MRTELEQIFGNGGKLQSSLPGFEPRAAQLQMAEAVWAALADHHPALIEAKTGTGKTLAYLAPAVLSGQRVVISTGTRHLQEQLYHKDIPVLRKSLQVPFSAVRLKGINNYLCRRRLALVRDSLPGSNPSLTEILNFAALSKTGDRGELAGFAEDDPLLSQVIATHETRIGKGCPHFETCFVTQARRAAQDAQIVIVNHHLLCADLAVRVRFPEARLLPPYDALICDEAHSLEEIATSYFGIQVDGGRLRGILRDLLQTPVQGATREAIAEAESAYAELNDALRRRLPTLLPDSESADALRIPLSNEQLHGPPTDAVMNLDNALLAIAESCLAVPKNSEHEEISKQVARRAQALRDDLALIFEGAGRPSAGYVYWMEWVPGQVDLRLRAAPVSVAGLLSRRLYADCSSVVLTSATLAPSGNFAYARARLGLSEIDTTQELVLESPFDYKRQAVLYLPDDLPEPNDGRFLSAACVRIEQLVALTGGRAFLLFTSHKRMQRAYDDLARKLGHKHLVLIQGEAEKHQLVARFAQAPQGAVLFATFSFWEGVDVVGPALQLVVIDKLPFAPPDDPLLSARCRRLEEDGYDAFACYQVPRAAVLLAQGFGRLIRHREDFGIVALLDRRASERGYGARVLSLLPKELGRVSDLSEVARFYRGGKVASSRYLP